MTPPASQAPKHNAKVQFPPTHLLLGSRSLTERGHPRPLVTRLAGQITIESLSNTSVLVLFLFNLHV